MAARPVKGHQDNWGWSRGHELIWSPRRRQKGDFIVLCDYLWDGAENVEPELLRDSSITYDKLAQGNYFRGEMHIFTSVLTICSFPVKMC